MRYLALCTDYDGTIAHHGVVDEPTIAALEKLRASGRRLLLVTGRELEDLQRVFDRLDLFERVVAENGALIYRPATREERVLCEAPPPRFVEERKSTVAAGLIERLRDKDYAFCVIDPEGDYDLVEGAVVLGGPERAPSVDECLQLLSKPNQNAVFNLLGIEFADRPAFFMSLLARIRDLRAKTGRPHYLIVDEAHHVMPADWQPTELALPPRFDGIMLVSVTPASIAPAALRLIETVIVLGDKPREMLREFAAAHELDAPALSDEKLPEGRAVIWNRRSTLPPAIVVLEPTRTERRRHLRKYAEGSLGEDRSFYFRGPEGKLNLRAQNLTAFMDLADGVDEDTWLFHLRGGEISRWMRDSIKDDSLANSIAALERGPADAHATRKRVRDLIEERYTLPAEHAAGS
jgi:hypothetical protein